MVWYNAGMSTRKPAHERLQAFLDKEGIGLDVILPTLQPIIDPQTRLLHFVATGEPRIKVLYLDELPPKETPHGEH